MRHYRFTRYEVIADEQARQEFNAILMDIGPESSTPLKHFVQGSKRDELDKGAIVGSFSLRDKLVAESRK